MTALLEQQKSSRMPGQAMFGEQGSATLGCENFPLANSGLGSKHHRTASAGEAVGYFAKRQGLIRVISKSSQSLKTVASNDSGDGLPKKQAGIAFALACAKKSLVLRLSC